MSKDRYRSFLRSLRMWRHIKMVKRGGRSYDPTGIKGTSPGELAVLCPACPLPSINLPPNWHSIGKDLGFVSLDLQAFMLLTASIIGIFTTKHLGLMLAFGSSEGRFQVMRKIQSLAPDMPTSSHGSRIPSTSVNLPIRRRFVTII